LEGVASTIRDVFTISECRAYSEDKETTGYTGETTKMKNKLKIYLTIFALIFPSTAFSLPAYFVESDWLSEHIDDENLVVLEVRYHPHRYFTVGHIPGAIQVQRFKDLGDNEANPLMYFPSMESFQTTLRSWGINDNSTLILYDDSNTALLSRLYYLLHLYGFNMEQVKVLNEGTVEWSGFEEMS
jgi:thiosulfate/3-mercaptopyruvate sulfurtransferase